MVMRKRQSKAADDQLTEQSMALSEKFWDMMIDAKFDPCAVSTLLADLLARLVAAHHPDRRDVFLDEHLAFMDKLVAIMDEREGTTDDPLDR
jgi:hypothetical protein